MLAGRLSARIDGDCLLMDWRGIYPVRDYDDNAVGRCKSWPFLALNVSLGLDRISIWTSWDISKIIYHFIKSCHLWRESKDRFISFKIHYYLFGYVSCCFEAASNDRNFILRRDITGRPRKNKSNWSAGQAESLSNLKIMPNMPKDGIAEDYILKKIFKSDIRRWPLRIDQISLHIP